MTRYDRTLAQMSHRELMKLAGLLRAAAVAPPFVMAWDELYGLTSATKTVRAFAAIRGAP